MAFHSAYLLVLNLKHFSTREAKQQPNISSTVDISLDSAPYGRGGAGPVSVKKRAY